MPAEFDRTAAWERLAIGSGWREGRHLDYDRLQAAFLAELAAAERAARESMASGIPTACQVCCEGYRCLCWQTAYRAAQEECAKVIREHLTEYGPPRNERAAGYVAALTYFEGRFATDALAASPAARTGGT